jgi:AraC-like DNA-binding protein
MANIGLNMSFVDLGNQPRFFSRQIIRARRFYLDLSPPRAQRLSVICGGGEHCAADYAIDRGGFPYFCLEFVAGGQGTLNIAHRRHRLVPGAVFAYGPGVPHRIRSDPARPLVKYFVNFVGPAGRRLLRPPAPRPGEVVQCSAMDHLLQLFEELIDAGLRDSPYRPAICTALVEHLLLRVAETAVPLGTVGVEAFETYQRCRRYIEANYRALSDLPELAQRCRATAAYICRLYRRFDHQSPWQHVIRLRMRDAAQRLQTSHKLVREVADEFGFGDAFQFSRTFRRVLGVSPRRFVQLQRR